MHLFPVTFLHKITSGFFVENTIIVAEGELLVNGVFEVIFTCNISSPFYKFWILVWSNGYVNYIFSPVKQIHTCGFPPLEDRELSVSVLAGLDFFGCGTFSKDEIVCLLSNKDIRFGYLMTLLKCMQLYLLVSSVVFIIGQACRFRKTCGGWHVCHLIWCLVGLR